MTTFSGYPQDAFDWFAELEANNNREWYEANKDRRETAIIEPSIALVMDLGEQLQSSVTPEMQFNVNRSNGSIRRIHRDIRFSKDKTPFNTFQRLSWWVGNGKHAEVPGFGLGISAKGGGVYAGMYGFPKPILTKYREAVDAKKSGEKLEKIMHALEKNEALQIGGKHYKRVPREYPDDHPRGELLKFNALYAYNMDIPIDVMKSPELLDVAEDYMLQMKDLFLWLVDLTQ